MLLLLIIGDYMETQSKWLAIRKPWDFVDYYVITVVYHATWHPVVPGIPGNQSMFLGTTHVDQLQSISNVCDIHQHSTLAESFFGCFTCRLGDKIPHWICPWKKLSRELSRPRRHYSCRYGKCRLTSGLFEETETRLSWGRGSLCKQEIPNRIIDHLWRCSDDNVMVYLSVCICIFLYLTLRRAAFHSRATGQSVLVSIGTHDLLFS